MKYRISTLIIFILCCSQIHGMEKLFKRLFVTRHLFQQACRQTTFQRQHLAYFSNARSKHNRVKRFKTRKVDIAPIYNKLFNDHTRSNNEKKQLAEQYIKNKSISPQDRNDLGILAIFLGQNITQRNSFFHGNPTLLHRAVFLKRRNLFNTIFAYNSIDVVGINTPDPYGDTPLLIAALVRDPISAAKLIACDAYVNVENPQGDTPLLITIKTSTPEELENTRDTAKLLVDNGTDTNKKDKHGKKPIDYVDEYLKDLEKLQTRTMYEEHGPEKLCLQEIKKILEQPKQ